MKYLILLLALFTSFAHANHDGKHKDHMDLKEWKKADSEKASKLNICEVSMKLVKQRKVLKKNHS